MGEVYSSLGTGGVNAVDGSTVSMTDKATSATVERNLNGGGSSTSSLTEVAKDTCVSSDDSDDHFADTFKDAVSVADKSNHNSEGVEEFLKDQDSTPVTSLNNISLPFTILSDNATQTINGVDELVHCGIQTDIGREDLPEEVSKDDLKHLVEKANRQFSDQLIQTETESMEEKVEPPDVCDSCEQTEEITIKELVSLADLSVQTEVGTDCCQYCSAPLNGHGQPGQAGDYLHCDDAAAHTNSKDNGKESPQMNGEIGSAVEEEQANLHDEKQGNKIESLEGEKLVNGFDHSDEWETQYMELEKKVEEEIAMRKLLEEDYRNKLEYLRGENLNMKKVVEQYEGVIVELTEQNKDRATTDAQLSATINDKKQAIAELSRAEGNLMDAYTRIEKLKGALDTYKQNEDCLKGSLSDFEAKLSRSEEKYIRLKKDATEKIDAANIEIEKNKKQKEVDLAGLQAALKKSQNRNAHLEKEIQQKTQESTELSQICDELIKRVSVEQA